MPLHRMSGKTYISLIASASQRPPLALGLQVRNTASGVQRGLIRWVGGLRGECASDVEGTAARGVLLGEGAESAHRGRPRSCHLIEVVRLIG